MGQSNSGTHCAKPDDFVYSLSLKQEQLAADWLSLGVARLSQTRHTTDRNVEVLSFFFLDPYSDQYDEFVIYVVFIYFERGRLKMVAPCVSDLTN